MKIDNRFAKYMILHNQDGSNKATSYIRALELLGPILSNSSSRFSHCSDIFAIESIPIIDELYKYVIEQQSYGDVGIFNSKDKPSYWRSRFYSAALKSYKEFLILNLYQDEMWKLYNQPETDPSKLGISLIKKKIPHIKDLISENDIDFSNKEGKEKLQYVKTRVNQDFFRQMILKDYSSLCCVTGLNVPSVLIASHIVGWAEDKNNRLNPANGLCLSATYDAAFDSHLISFDNDFRLILGKSLKEYYSNEAFKTHFLHYEGHQIRFPKRFSPGQVFLEKHREKLS
jgi:putative restriction endonuclease